MPINGATLNEGATIAPSGGTAKTYIADGLQVNNGIHVVDTSVTDARVRPGLTAKSIPARIGANGEWSNDKRELVITRPKVLANGAQRFPNVRITLTVHPESTQAEIDMLTNLASQALVDADFTNLWRVGTIA